MPRTSDARERLVRSAARLFLERSYQGVGVDELCAAADVRKGSFYHFFGSKADLAMAVIDWHAAHLWQQLDTSAERATASNGGPGAAAALHAMADAVGVIQTGLEARFGRVVGCPFGNLAAELATADEPVRLQIAGVFEEWERRLAVLCQRAAAEGILRGGIEADHLARLLIAQFQGMVLISKTLGTPASDIPEALHRIIEGQLVPSPGTTTVASTPDKLPTTIDTQ